MVEFALPANSKVREGKRFKALVREAAEANAAKKRR